MRFATKERGLNHNERILAGNVFDDSLPSWERIRITDGMGPIVDTTNLIQIKWL
jgi:hypothetical protein